MAVLRPIAAISLPAITWDFRNRGRVDRLNLCGRKFSSAQWLLDPDGLTRQPPSRIAYALSEPVLNECVAKVWQEAAQALCPSGLQTFCEVCVGEATFGCPR